MEQFITFVMHHWALWLGLAIVVSLLLILEFQGKLRGIASLSPAQVTQFINHQEGVLVDIRDNVAFNKGHILNAIHIPVADIENSLAKLENYKTKPVIVVDSMGQQAVNAALQLRKHGFTSVYVLQSGITSWQNANLPLVKS